MSAAWGTFTRSVSPTWTFSSFCSASLMTMALKGCSPVLSRRGAAFPAQKVKKFSVTPRMFTLDARVAFAEQRLCRSAKLLRPCSVGPGHLAGKSGQRGGHVGSCRVVPLLSSAGFLAQNLRQSMPPQAHPSPQPYKARR